MEPYPIPWFLVVSDRSILYLLGVCYGESLGSMSVFCADEEYWLDQYS
jgi:hypothetical protein